MIICYHDSREIMVGKGQYQRKLTMGEGEKLVWKREGGRGNKGEEIKCLPLSCMKCDVGSAASDLRRFGESLKCLAMFSAGWGGPRKGRRGRGIWRRWMGGRGGDGGRICRIWKIGTYILMWIIYFIEGEGL